MVRTLIPDLCALAGLLLLGVGLGLHDVGLALGVVGGLLLAAAVWGYWNAP